ncbi:MAG: sugar phosphate isomerase/epimerase [Anaerolineae bacterium]|nr:sugar phosphate isomerase/epimerase [Anaerolineae bacterium]
MKACINEATTMNTDLLTDLQAYAEAGFESVEVWIAKLEALLEKGGSLDQVQTQMERVGIRAVAVCAQGGCLLADGQQRRTVLAELRRRLLFTRALGADVLTVYSESPEKVEPSDWEAAPRRLAEVADLADEQGITIALEFIKGSRLIGSLATAARVIAAANRPNLGVAFDTFHFYAGISKMADLENLDVSRLALVHVNDVGDTPRETWTDADRVLPGTGVLPLMEMLGLIHGKGYEGHVSLELFSRELWDADPFTAARLAHEAMQQLLAGLT